MGKLAVKREITAKQIKELLDFSGTDEQVKRFTSDPERFKNKAAFAKWRCKGRTLYSLAGASGNLLGVIWFGEKACPVKEESACRTTFAIRIYGKARGKGLAGDFMKIVFDDYLRLHPGLGGIWLETFFDNLAAQKVYERFGFRRLAGTENGRKVIMTYYPSA